MIAAILALVASLILMVPAAVEVPSAAAGASTPNPRLGMPTLADAQAWALEELGPRQAGCLFRIVERESRWRVDAVNRRSGAYGLPQALPGSKMARYGSDWRTNPVTQLRWMAGYVHGRYGSACAALAYSREHGNY